MMGNLRRDAAPLTERTWKAIDEAVAQAARHVLRATRGHVRWPAGWDHAATRLGTMKPCATREGKATVCVEEMALLAEVRAEFTLSWTTLDLFDRGAPALDTSPAENAAREVALAEDRIVFYGEPVGHGLLISKESPTVTRRTGRSLVRRSPMSCTPWSGSIRTASAAPMSSSWRRRGTTRSSRAPRARADTRPRAPRDVIAGVHRSNVIRDAGAVFSTRGMTSSLRLVATSPSAIAVTTPRAFTCSASRPSLLSSSRPRQSACFDHRRCSV